MKVHDEKEIEHAVGELLAVLNYVFISGGEAGAVR